MKVQSLLLYNDRWHSYTFPKDFQGKSEKYRYIQSESEITLFPDDLGCKREKKISLFPKL